MTHGSLFSGIGGFDLAAEWMGWENKFHCEWNPFGQRVLKYYWPNAASFNDITKTNFTPYANRIDVLTGGFPCQPYSQAGKRLGKDDERHLWPEMLRAIREISPRYVVGENVRGLINWNGGLVFDEVQADLETQGYEVTPFLLPAAGVNAPHERYRIWFVAHSHSGEQSSVGKNNANNSGKEIKGTWAENNPIVFGRNGTQGIIADTDSINGRDRASGGNRSEINNCSGGGDVTNASNAGLQGGQIVGGIESIGENGNEQFAGCIPSTWEKFPTQSPFCNGNDGFSSKLDGITFSKWREQSIKAAGNAIVPRVALQIFQAIRQYQNLVNQSKL